MNYKLLSQQLIQAIRVKSGKSQAYLNKKFGCKYNRIYKWESGEVNISWSDFLSLLDFCKIDFRKLFCEVYDKHNEIETKDHSQFIQRISGNRKPSDVSSSIGVNLRRYQKWLDGKGSPKLFEILCLLQFCESNLGLLLSEIVDIESIPEINEIYNKYQADLGLFKELPYLAFVVDLLVLPQYRNLTDYRSEVIANLLGVDVKIVDQAVLILEQMNYIKKVGNKFAVVDKDINFDGDFESMKKMQGYLTACVSSLLHPLDREKARRLKDFTQFGHLAFSVSEKTLKEIGRLHHQFLVDVKSLCNKDQELPDKFAVVNVQTFGLEAIRAQNKK